MKGSKKQKKEMRGRKSIFLRAKVESFFLKGNAFFKDKKREGSKREIRMQRKRNSGTKQRGGNGKRYMGKKNGKRMNREDELGVR